MLPAKIAGLGWYLPERRVINADLEYPTINRETTGGTRPFFPDTIRRMILLASPHILDY